MTYVYQAWASEYARLGLLVVGFNQPGMGSPGVPGLCEAWSGYVDNVLFATDTAVRLMGGTWNSDGHPDVPVFIYGQSMGGALAICASRQRPNAYRGVLLSAPMCGIAPDALPNGCAVGMLRCLEWLAPQAQLVPQEDLLDRCFKCRAQVTRVRAKSAEKNMPTQPRLRTGVQLLDATLDIQAHVADFAPAAVLLVQGTLDKVTDGQLTRDFIQRCSSPDRSFIAYTNAWHAMEWEPVDTRMALIHDLTYWVAVRVDAWEAANDALADALRGRQVGAAEPHATTLEPQAMQAPVSFGGASAGNPEPKVCGGTSHLQPSVKQGTVPAGDADLQWEESGGVLWAVREEGVGIIPDHDELSFFTVRSSEVTTAAIADVQAPPAAASRETTISKDVECSTLSAVDCSPV
jgi:acylglycerol lipase